MASRNRPWRLVGRLLAPLRRLPAALRTTGRTVARVPDAIEAILVLPTLSRQLEAVVFNTATLPEMHEEIARMRRLVAEVESNTTAVQELVELAVPLQRAALRVGRLADRIPQRRIAAR